METFAILKDGLSFDRKRFASDIQLFSAPPTKHSKIEAPQTPNIRKEFSIHTTGENVPLPVPSFSELFSSYKVPASTQSTILSLYENLTPVQMQAVPILLSKRDLIGIAPTGSGKSLSFILPLITLLSGEKGLRGLVIAPTKELARQLFKEFLLFSEGTGLKAELLSKKGKDCEGILQNCDILICTPLLMVHLFENHDLPSIEYIVVDEADQLFDLGYLDQVDTILKKCPGGCNKWMFSATMLPAIEILAYSMLINPIKISIGIQNSTVQSVVQELKFCTNEAGKIICLKQMVQMGEFTPPVLIFVQSKDRAIQLALELKGIVKNVAAMHSALDDRQRDAVIKNFRTGGLWVLICTDLLSRGIDFHNVKLVINFDFPQSIISYIHRIGRAGRAGEEAKALTLYTLEDAPYIKMISNVMKKSGCQVPEWMENLKGPSKSIKKRLEKKPPRRENITLGHRLSRGLRKYLKHKKDKDVEKVDN